VADDLAAGDIPRSDMLYTLAEAAKATGLAENLIVSAIEHGQVTSTKDLSGEWRIEDEELHRLYLSIAQDYCKRKSQLEPRRNEGTISEAHVADIAEGSVQRTAVDSIGESRTGAEQGESAASRWEDEINIDDRDRLSVSDPRRTRTSFLTRTALAALACIAVLGSFYLLGQSLISNQRVNSLAQILDSEKERMPLSTSAAASVDKTAGGVPAVPANGIDHPQDSRQSSSQVSSRTPAITKKDTKESHPLVEKSQTKLLANRAPIPETRPTTIKGWTLRSVAGGTATLEGPGGI
jgi:hypothetical protein